MNVDKKEFNDLCYAYFDEEGTPDQMLCLKEMLKTDDACLDRFALIADEISYLKRLAKQGVYSQKLSKTHIDHVTRPFVDLKKVRRFSRSSWLLIAASLLITTLAYFVIDWRAGNTREPLQAMVVCSESVVNARVLRSGVWMPVHQNMPLYVLDTIDVGDDGSLQVKYDDEDTRIDLSENTQIEFPSPEKGKLILLKFGRIDADVAQQPVGQNMTVITDQAKIDVVGTRFSLHVQLPSVLNNQPSSVVFTRLEVSEGLVRFMRLSDKETVDVATGQYVIAEKTVSLVVEPIEQFSRGIPITRLSVGPESSGYFPGSILFEDNFDTDLENWDLLVGDDCLRLFPLLDSSEKVFSMVFLAKKPVGLDDFGDWISSYLEVWPRRLGDRAACIRLNVPLEGDAFEVQAFMHMSRLFELTPFPSARVLRRELSEFVDRKTPPYCRLRWECFPAGQLQDGTPIMEIRTFLRNLRQGVLHKEVWYSTSYVVCEDSRPAFATGAMIRIQRVLIRRMRKG